MAVYLVDSNFFIQAHRAIYPLDVATGFWALVKRLAEDGIIISIDKVKDELYDRNDDLEKWCRTNLPTDFFQDTSTIMAEYSSISAFEKRMEISRHFSNKILMRERVLPFDESATIPQSTDSK